MKNVEMKKLSKAAMAMALAGTFAFSPALASADTLTEGQKVQAETSVTTDVQVKNDAEKPALVPGDFFYFVKIALEKIKLAITFDKEKEADLLAGYAAERLAEAEELFNAGKEDMAIKTLKDSIAYLNQYDAKADEPKSDEQKSDEPKSDEQKTEDQTESSEQQPATDEETSKDEPADEEKAVENDEDKEGSSEELVRNNIVALKAALEKVKNPTAKAALQRNIDRTLAKMAEKAEEVAKEEEKIETEKAAEAEKVTEIEKAETEKAVSVDAKTAVKAETKVEKPAVKAVPATPAAPAAAAKQEAKQKVKEIRQQANQKSNEVRKQANQEVKEIRSEAKQQVKEVKQAEKAAKFEAKAQVNVEKKENGKGAGHGKNGN
ncbi:hypothetical protein DRW41_01965 [Neobacillus piezotolerans]|uniref:DUF5667 domain-containing protein n=1 Tax=Neobacillus piezotolerans TaxID=2259171 RepID=A0A3D8GV97_9BACI|nr:DUF5667 domain-containing protein [Neobacillus piezotolerans]RDU38357.1 hypothetical protein DRW41_01965 [Neobacillus piezotolerans]